MTITYLFDAITVVSIEKEFEKCLSLEEPKGLVMQ